MFGGSFIAFSKKAGAVRVHVGVILDGVTISGKMMNVCTTLALSDFHANRNRVTQVVPHYRNSKSDDVTAASAAIDLLKNVEVQAILGPQGSTQADFIADIGKRVKVPIISPARSSALSSSQNPYFIRAAYCSCAQSKAIAAIVEAFGWREVVIIYENSNLGGGILPHLTDALMDISVSVADRRILSPRANDDQIMLELAKIKKKRTRVFIVHLHPAFAPHFFVKVKEAGMMSSGYVWIITDEFTTLSVSMNPSVLDSLCGVIGVKPYVPSSVELKNFTKRWKSKEFRQENPDMDGVELNVFGLWAYDSAMALATALEKVGNSSLQFDRTFNQKNLTDLEALGTSQMGPTILESIRNIKFRGVSGYFQIVDGEMQPSAFEIVNVVGGGVKGIGFWTEKYGISKKLNPNVTLPYSAKQQDLGAIIWPGDSTVVPKGWEIPTGKRKLKVGVPVKQGFEQFVKVTIDPQTKKVVNATGFCIEVFEEVMKSMPYYVPFEYEAFHIPRGESRPNYDDLVEQVNLERYDAVVGDITILANRSKLVDFTLPFIESGVTTVVPVKHADKKKAWIFLKPLRKELWVTIAMSFVFIGITIWVLEHQVNKEFQESGVTTVVPVKHADKKKAWIFLKPLRKELWVTIAMSFVFIGITIWVLEHQVNKEFQGPRYKQVGMIFWFSFSTLVFAHKERVISNLSRFVIIVWVFVVLVLTSSYTASLTSMLTVQQLQPTVTDLKDLIKNREYVGFQDGSYVSGLLDGMRFDRTKIRNYTTLEEYDKALTRGSKDEGVAAIVDELPFLRIFLSKYCGKYTIVGPTYKNAGFGFAFAKGSPLVRDVSRAVLHVKESCAMRIITEKWLGKGMECSQQDGTSADSDRLALDSFMGLFVIAGASALSALLIYFCSFLNQNKDILKSDLSIRQKFTALAKAFCVERVTPSRVSQMLPEEGNAEAAPEFSPQCPEARTSYSLGQDIVNREDGFPTTEPGSPENETFSITEEGAER
ncbi:unnamed protein product [Cuscuta campestris]|uniref:Ionotropic glutamate receptor C-terminal domain-containing protein n=1 Tax=Cuscuta campestris TaxID=132261 RepID=A0A484NFB2_9ASTE|nr:unnamed protein product [Cuscuta campestris]